MSGEPLLISMSTIGRMTGELGFLADVQTVEDILTSSGCTLKFDATTQDDIHVNCIMLNTRNANHLVSIKHLAGGTAIDYAEHVIEAVYFLAKGIHAEDTRNNIILKINACLTDRAPVNAATLNISEGIWGILIMISSV